MSKRKPESLKDMIRRILLSRGYDPEDVLRDFEAYTEARSRAEKKQPSRYELQRRTELQRRKYEAAMEVRRLFEVDYERKAPATPQVYLYTDKTGRKWHPTLLN